MLPNIDKYELSCKKTSVYRFLCGHKFLTDLGKYQGAQLLHHMVSFVRNCQSVFQSGCTVFHPHQQWINTAPHPHQNLVLSVIWMCDLDLNYGRYLVVSHCSFNLHFPHEV